MCFSVKLFSFNGATVVKEDSDLLYKSRIHSISVGCSWSRVYDSGLTNDTCVFYCSLANAFCTVRCLLRSLKGLLENRRVWDPDA